MVKDSGHSQLWCCRRTSFKPRSPPVGNGKRAAKTRHTTTGVEGLSTKEHAARAGVARSSISLPEYRLSFASLLDRSQGACRRCSSRSHGSRNSSGDGRQECTPDGESYRWLWPVTSGDD